MPTKPSGMAVSDLLPCPFCDGDAVWGYNNDGGIFIRCQRCDASSTMIYPLKEAAEPKLIELWNARTRFERIGRSYVELWEMGAPWPVRHWTCDKHQEKGCLKCR